MSVPPNTYNSWVWHICRNLCHITSSPMWTAKQSFFFSKLLNKSRTSHAHEVCGVREKLASLPSFALRFQPHSRHFVWLLAGTWIHKNTHCFVVYHRCWFTDKFTHLQKKWVSALGKKRRSRHRGSLNRLVQKVWQEKSSALVPCHRNCHCPNPGPTPTPIPPEIEAKTYMW